MESTRKPIRLNSHNGELEMRRKLPSKYRWDDRSLSAMIHSAISPSFAKFIEEQPFFFIATSSGEGDCDASFRGQNHSPTGKPFPTVKVEDHATLIFPDYCGNGLYNSLGNIFSNPRIGMLFINFSEQIRIRVNGKAVVEDVSQAEAEIWPDAQVLIRVRVEQVYRNSSARIPKMQMHPNRDMIFS